MSLMPSLLLLRCSESQMTNLCLHCFLDFPDTVRGCCFGTPPQVSLPSRAVSASWLPIKMRKEVTPPLLPSPRSAYREQCVPQMNLHKQWKLESASVRCSDSSFRPFSGHEALCVELVGCCSVLIGVPHWSSVSLLSTSAVCQKTTCKTGRRSPSPRKSATFLTTHNLCLVSLEEARWPASLSRSMTHCPLDDTFIHHRPKIPIFCELHRFEEWFFSFVLFWTQPSVFLLWRYTFWAIWM